MASVWATKKLKARITFPRGGYVEWKEPTRTQRVIGATIAMITAALLAALVVRARAQGTERVAPAVFGVLLSLGFVVASLTQRAPHMLALAGVALALGLAFGALDLGWQSMNWMMVVLGLATTLSGSLRLGHVSQAEPARESRMTDLDRVIHEPARLMLVALLAGVKEADFLWLQRESRLTKGNLSSHLARLERRRVRGRAQDLQGQNPVDDSAVDPCRQERLRQLQEEPERPSRCQPEPGGPELGSSRDSRPELPEIRQLLAPRPTSTRRTRIIHGKTFPSGREARGSEIARVLTKAQKWFQGL